MSGLELFNSNTEMRITYGSRTVLTTEGTLINLLPPSYDINQTFDIVFPDIIKGYYYAWQHLFSYTSLGNSVAYDSFCATQLTACPQEFEQTTTLATAPSGADIFVGRIRLNRTVAPSHTWNGATIQPLQPMNADIPLVSGSLLMESVIGMSRACSIYVSGGNLVLNREQSVSTAPGGWNLFGTSYNYLNPQNGGGGENVHGGTAGVPILQFDSVNVPADVVSPANNPAYAYAYDQRTRRGGPNACAIPNPSNYNYSSTYQAVLTGSFGRRS